MAVISVGGDDGVVVVGTPDGAYGYCFLAGVDMTEPTDFGLLVGLHGSVFELTDELHVVEPFDEYFLWEVLCGLCCWGKAGQWRICFRGVHRLVLA